ncbi:MAG: hypothetical protein DRJ96_08120, partial [Thermoprotei archaeon]
EEVDARLCDAAEPVAERLAESGWLPGPGYSRVLRGLTEEKLTFQGRLGRGLWHGTPVEEALPVEFQEFDDRVETPEGAYLRVVDPEHPLMRGIPWEACPPLLGYNRAKLKPGAKLLATISRAGRAEEDPLIAVWDYGSGRSMAFASDITPHWGTNFIGWDYYKPFWVRAIKWLAGEL